MEKKVGGQIIHYDVVHPQGKVKLIVLHGWGQSGSFWQRVAELLPENISCYLIDLPGFGRSPLGEDTMTLDDYAQVVIEFIKDLGEVVVLGHSFGGQLAVRVAVNTKVDKLILVAPAIKRERNTWSKKWYRLLALLAKLGKFLPARWTYQLSSGTNYSEASPKLKLVFQNLIGVDVTSDLLSIPFPTLCIWGEKDQEILGSAKDLVSKLPHGRLKVIYDAGHNLQVEKPKELIRLIERWVC